MDSLFEFLFKYRPLIFERGDFVMTGSVGLLLGVLALTVLLVPTALLYGVAGRKVALRDRVILSALRIAVLGVLVFAVFRPRLVLSTSVPQKNFLAVLLDDSRSMRVADLDGESRAEVLSRTLAADGDLWRELSERFLLRVYAFSDVTNRIGGVDQLGFRGHATDLATGVDRVRQELSATPAAGIVVLTDGADNRGESLDETIVSLRASSLPVYTVGLGREVFSRDISLERVETPREVLKGTSLAVDLLITQRGYGREEVELYVEDSGRIVHSQTVRLPAAGQSERVRVHVRAEESGPRLFRFRIPAREDEMVEQNNEQFALVVVSDRTERILYFEGEPRFELKFLKRAVEDDRNLQVVTLLRTAENKFYARDVDDGDELAGGFPRTREDLFRYRGLVLGSVEASFFTHDQLRMISDFVSQRGGGLLVLGGPRSFAEGGYAGTPLEDVLPVVLDAPAPDYFAEVGVAPTPAGLSHAVTQLAGSEEESEVVWENLPAVSVLNPLTRIKPGAVTLLRGTLPSDEDQILLAYQRYGRGRSMVFTAQDSWIWQMHADIPLEDQTHETFWKQTLRWLISGVPRQVNLSTPADRVAPGDRVEVTATVEDETYLRLNDTVLELQVVDPLGSESLHSLEWSVERDGEYRTTIEAGELGTHMLVARAERGGDFIGVDTTWIQVDDLETEFYDAELRAGTLQRLARETGGKYYTPDAVESLAEDISFTTAGTTVVEERDLWDMPVIFLLVIGLLSTEWAYRRLRGLA